jgi:hypothetical protein
VGAWFGGYHSSQELPSDSGKHKNGPCALRLPRDEPAPNPGPQAAPAGGGKSDQRSHCAIVQPRLYDSAMVTLITLGRRQPRVVLCRIRGAAHSVRQRSASGRVPGKATRAGSALARNWQRPAAARPPLAVAGGPVGVACQCENSQARTPRPRPSDRPTDSEWASVLPPLAGPASDDWEAPPAPAPPRPRRGGNLPLSARRPGRARRRGASVGPARRALSEVATAPAAALRLEL